MSSRDKSIPETPAGDSADDSPFGDPVVLPIEDCLDLHAFSPKDIPSVVEEYLEQCLHAGFSEVRLIHGKGIGVQRNIVRSILSKLAGAASFHDAPAEAGGWGATIVILKKKS
ncbi:MAG TPA: Smr/MutS family protein [Candidatus Limnocylindria bacterium]|nr:Smr/MutS family protein [Candidatus Limnocylindria bacterium]